MQEFLSFFDRWQRSTRAVWSNVVDLVKNSTNSTQVRGRKARTL